MDSARWPSRVSNLLIWSPRLKDRFERREAAMVLAQVLATAGHEAISINSAGSEGKHFQKAGKARDRK
jgi:hypothetical protein